ncbi:MAG: hypothetical protein ABSF22_15170 [Bryobacteraceae bacterium]
MSFAVVLCAAVVALICDSLKRSNEQLRELTIELNIRREEEQKRSHAPLSHVAERVERPKPEQIEAPAVASVAVPAKTPVPAASNVTHPAVGKDKKRSVNAGALAAMERGAALAGTGKRPRPMPAPAPLAEHKPEMVVSQEVAKPTIQAAAKKDWGSLLSRNARQKPTIVVNPSAASAPTAEPSLPAGFQGGFQDGHVLNKLVQSRQPISGLVVSIGVNAARKSDGSLPESVTTLVQSLVGPNDFAAQSSDDEFLLIYPQEQGASAQRRLSQIAQKLWDFQLRSLGSFQILFSWGGVEVRSESIEEAIASASERMQETKRGRKLLTMASPAPTVETQLRQAM